jgi:glutathione S-transferase
MDAQTGPYTLYCFPFSAYSIIVRYAFALRGEPKEQSIEIEEHLINLHKDEEVTEWYLTKVNSKGQVPALTSPKLADPITESVDIILFMANFYPSLLPHEHKDTIQELLQEGSTIQLASLSTPPHKLEQYSSGVPALYIQDLLNREDISPQYRKSLEFKRDL